ncbi:hypothetical protein SCG7109_AD_00050 [Chlamydiales bacterium SCGC AG-110-M15]|nr:hypothetical protein SCG7109_AD_00050 [Chlamydiales bacterium SCGC AG-110-M15]
MPRLIHCNTYFEFELSGQQCFPLATYLEKMPLILQLQYIPLLFASSEDYLLVSHMPSDKFIKALHDFLPNPPPQLCTLETLPQADELATWAYSKQWAKWAQKNQLSYQMPDWECVAKVNSKAFCTKHAQQLPGSQLIHSKAELDRWVGNQKQTFVLKTIYGVASTENITCEPKHIHFSKRQQKLVENEWKLGRPLIAEPWVERVDDFSSHWRLSNNGTIQFIAATPIQNTASGCFINSLYEPDEQRLHKLLPYLNEHKSHAIKLLELIAKEGYYGPVSFDAMTYVNASRDTKLHPIVEINARQTMALANVLCQHRHFPGKTLRMGYTQDDADKHLLPSTIESSSGRVLNLPKQISLEVVR